MSDTFLNVLDKGIIPFIVLSGVVLIVLLVGNYIVLVGHYNNIESIMGWENKKSSVNRRTHEITAGSEKTKATPDDIIELETAFNKTCSWHEAFSQLIPLFPLFGILGTVAGLILMLQHQSGNVIDYNDLYLALRTTLYGLIFAIILKFIDAMLPSRKIYDTEIILNDFDKKFNTAVMLDNITE